MRTLAYILLALGMGMLVAVLPWEASAAVLLLAGIGFALLFSPLAGLSLLLVVSPLRTLVATESPLQLPLDPGQLAFLLLVAVLLLHRIVRKEPLLRVRWTPLYIPLLLFIAASGLTVFSAHSLNFWLTEWLKWGLMIFFVYLLLEDADSMRWQWVLFFLVSAGLANALIGLYIFVGGSGADHLLINERFFRAFGTFGQPNPFGGFMGLLLPLSLSATLGYGLRWRRQRRRHEHFVPVMFFALASAVLLAALVASWSRGAWLSFVAASGVMVFALPRKLWQSVTLSLVGIAAVLGVWFSGALPQSIVTRIASSTEEFLVFQDVRGVDITTANYAVVERLAHWQAAQNMAQAHPWLGVGFGNYEVAYEPYRLFNWEFALGHAHNYYLNILAEAGIVGLLAYLGLWLVVFIMSWRTRNHPDPLARLVTVGLLGSWTYLTFHSFLDNLYVNNLFMHLGAMLGILAVLHRQTWHSLKWEST